MQLEQLLACARGDAPVDLLLTGARVVDVWSGEVREDAVAIIGSRIAGFGPRAARQTIDLAGAYVAPGLIDAHVHIESALVTPAEFARAVVPRGTTTVVTDPHEIANVLGLEGVRFMFDSAKYGPLSMFVMASSCVPASPMETSGAALHAADLVSLKEDAWVLGLAEVMSFPGVVGGDPEVVDKLRLFAGSVIDGHAPGLDGPALDAYVAAGIGSDHECTTLEEARDRLRRGMTVFLREATNARNLDALLPLVTPRNQHRFCLCTDDRVPADLLDEGHIDHLVRKAIAGGVDPIDALRMATCNPAGYFRLADRGGIGPGLRADLIVFDDLAAPRPRLVFRGGKLVARDGAVCWEPPATTPRRLRGTVNVAWDRVDLRIAAAGERVRAIGVVPDQLVTERLEATPRVADGLAHADADHDLLKIAVIERHTGASGVGLGFVRGFGLRRGALASTVAHDHHNLVVVGADDDSMRTAARRAGDLGGGMVVADGERVLAEAPLPLAGLMSDQPIEVVRTQLDAVRDAARALGCPLHDPMMQLSFLALEVIPTLKLTDHGLIDVEAFAPVPLWV